MATFYGQHSRFFVGIDCIIFCLTEGRVCVLLARRRFEPEKGKWSLMGGFVRENESIDQAARRVLFDLTGLDRVTPLQVRAFGELERDPGARVISIAYYAMLNASEYDPQRLREHEAVWVPLNELPPLGFDHPQMIEAALEKLRTTIVVKPYIFRLLPERFTLTQMQQVFETLLDEEIDKRNFRKRVLENPCIEKTDEIDKTSSRRGAALYRFNRECYEKQYRGHFKL